MTNLVVPPKTALRLRTLWVRANSGAEVAAAAQQAAKLMFEEYQQQMASCLEMLGVDSQGRYWVDFENGEIHEGDPPVSGIGSEGNAIQTNGRST